MTDKNPKFRKLLRFKLPRNCPTDRTGCAFTARTTKQCIHHLPFSKITPTVLALAAWSPKLRTDLFQKSLLHGLFLSISIFSVHLILRRPQHIDTSATPVSSGAALIMSVLLATGISMVVWLVRNSVKNPSFSFRPSRARILLSLGLAAIFPLRNWGLSPVTLGGLALFSLSADYTQFPKILGAIVCVAIPIYPISAMICYHTKNKVWLRLGIISVAFLSAFSGIILWVGWQSFP